MAQKSVYITKEKYPYFEEIGVNCTWFGGFSQAQKLRCIISVHENFKAAYPEYRICKISGASPIQTGRELSAMSLKKYVPSKNNYYCLESVFQTSRIYTNPQTGETAGPFREFLSLDGKTCKKKVKELSNGWHSCKYDFEGIICPIPNFHISLFYDWIYMNALLEDANKSVREKLLESGYNAFTDLATSSLNSQARSCAIFISIAKQGFLERIKDFENYCELFRVNTNNSPSYACQNSYCDVQLLGKNHRYCLIRPAVEQTFSKEDTEKYYQEYFKK